LKVALDATALQHTTSTADFRADAGGVGRYTAQLALALAGQFPEDEYLLVSDQPFALPGAAANLHAGDPPRNVLERRWWTYGLVRQLQRRKIQLFHGCNFEVPLPSPIPTVVTLHDLSPWLDQPWVDAGWRRRTARVRKRVPWLLRAGAVRHVITPSEAIRTEVIRFFHFPTGRVTAIPHAAAPQFRPSGQPSARPYFLFAGMLEPRKNVQQLLEAWSNVRVAHDLDLVIAGPRRDNAAVVDSLPGVVWKGAVSDQEMAELYSHALALVYPSCYEGFGLPVIEAMQCGAPVVVSHDPALRETAGDAALSAGSAPELAAAMLAIADNPELRARLKAQSLARAALFSWERTARRTREVYEKAMEK
jgi:glycosyltransferase involved in cell wall biosynthesis